MKIGPDEIRRNTYFLVLKSTTVVIIDYTYTILKIYIQYSLNYYSKIQS